MGAKRAQMAAQQRHRVQEAETLQAELRRQLEEARRERESAAIAAVAEQQRREQMEKQRAEREEQHMTDSKETKEGPGRATRRGSNRGEAGRAAAPSLALAPPSTEADTLDLAC